jgi:hypothetical protein
MSFAFNPLEPSNKCDTPPKREGAGHSLWVNPKIGEMEAVPRHNEDAIKDENVLRFAVEYVGKTNQGSDSTV